MSINLYGTFPPPENIRLLNVSDSDLENPLSENKEKSYFGSTKLTAKEVYSEEAKKFKEPERGPPTAAGDASVFLPRQRYLLLHQYEDKGAPVKTIGDIACRILYGSEPKEGLDSVVDRSTMENLGFFSSDPGAKTVVSEMNRTITRMGFIQHGLTIMRPSPDFDIAKNRQDIIRIFCEKETLLEEMKDLFLAMKKGETALLSCWDDKSSLPGAATNLYYKMHPIISERCNDSVVALDASALWVTSQKAVTSFMMGVSGVLLTGYAATELYRAVTDEESPESLRSYSDRYITSTSLGALGGILTTPNIAVVNAVAAAYAGITSLMNLPNTVAWFKADTAMVPLMKEVLCQVAGYYKAMKSMHALLISNPEIIAKLEKFEKLDNFIKNSKNLKELELLFPLFESFSFDENSRFFRPGAILLAWEYLHSGGGKQKKKGKEEGEGKKIFKGDIVRGAFEEALPAIAEIEVLFSAATLMKESEGRPVKYCFPDLLRFASDPVLQVEGAWNPIISPDKAVPNNLNLGGDSPRGVIISGPNYSGKSSLAKTMGLIAALIPYGIVPAGKATSVVFGCLQTSMNIRDNIGSDESGLSAQIVRIKEMVGKIDLLEERGEHCFSIFDESFTQTKAAQGASLLMSTLREIAPKRGNITIAVTHFDSVSEDEESRSEYKRYRVGEDHTLAEGTFAAGASNALDLARQAGLQSGIISRAEGLLSEKKN